MAKRKHYKDVLILYLFGELPPKKTEKIKAHLEICPECREELKKYEKISRLMDQRVYKKPPSNYWNNYWQKLQPRLKEGKRLSWRLYIPELRQLLYSHWRLIAAAFAVFLIVAVSWFWFFSALNNPEVMETALPEMELHEASPVPVAYINQATNQYLDEVKPILLEISNIQATSGGELVDLSLERELSQQLLLQNRLLRKAAIKNADPQLQSLLEDIEMVLIDISNLKEKNNEPSIHFIKENMGDLPMKIDLVASNIRGEVR